MIKEEQESSKQRTEKSRVDEDVGRLGPERLPKIVGNKQHTQTHERESWQRNSYKGSGDVDWRSVIKHHNGNSFSNIYKIYSIHEEVLNQ